MYHATFISFFSAFFFFFSSRRRHTRCSRDWSSDVCSSDLQSPESLAQIGGPQCSDGNRVGPARIPCPGAVLGYSARIHLECRCTRPTRTPSEVVTNAS